MDDEKKKKKLEKERLKKELQTKNRMLTLTIVISVLFILTIILYESFKDTKTFSEKKERDLNRNVNIKLLVDNKYVDRKINYLKFVEVPDSADKIYAINKDTGELFSYDYSEFSSKEIDKDFYYILGYYECSSDTCEVIELSNYHYEATILDGNNIIRNNYFDNVNEKVNIDAKDFGYLEYFEDSNKLYGYLYNNLSTSENHFFDIEKNTETKVFNTNEVYEVNGLDLENNLVYVVGYHEYNENELGYRKAPLNSLTVYNYKTWDIVKKLDNNYKLNKIMLGSNIYYIGYSDVDYYYNDEGSYNTYIYDSKFERINDKDFYHYVVNSDNTISFMDYSENTINNSGTKELLYYYYTYSTYDSNFKLINEITSINSKSFTPRLLKDYLLASELDSVNKDNTTNKVILINTNGVKKKNLFTLKENNIFKSVNRLEVNNKDCILVTIEDEIEEENIDYYYYIEQDKIKTEKTSIRRNND